jgi:hypothetical protein
VPQYLLSIFQPDGPSPAAGKLDRIMADIDALNQEIRAAGGWVFSAGLHSPATATVLRPAAGDLLITDGPFAEGKEHLGGFTVVEAPDLDVVLQWGGRLAQATGLPVEVRPLRERR